MSCYHVTDSVLASLTNTSSYVSKHPNASNEPANYSPPRSSAGRPSRFDHFFLCRRWRRAWKVEIWKYNHSIHQSLKVYLREHVPFNSQSRISLYLFFIFPEMYLKSSFVLRIIPALLRLLSPLALTCHQKQEENRSIYPSLRGMLSGHYSSTCHCFSLKRKKKKSGLGEQKLFALDKKKTTALKLKWKNQKRQKHDTLRIARKTV